VIFKAMQVRDSLLVEFRAEQGTRVMPFLTISREDSVPEEVVPGFVEVLTLAKIVKLGRQNSLDVLWIDCDDEMTSRDSHLVSEQMQLKPEGRTLKVVDPAVAIFSLKNSKSALRLLYCY